MTATQVIRDELTRGFILREFADKFGVMSTDFESAAIDRYRNDHIFHARVQRVVTDVMAIITKHTKTNEEGALTVC